MKSFLFATIASVLFLGSSAIVSGSPSEEAEDYASEETGQFFSGDSDDLSVIAKKKKGKGKKGKKGKKGGKKGKKSSTDAEGFDVAALLAIDADYNSPFETAVNVNADDEDAQFTSGDDDESFVSAKKKKGKGKKGKGKGKGKGKKGKGKKSSTDDESFDVSALLAIDASYSSPFETVVAANSDDEDVQFTSDEDDDQSFVIAKKKKGKGKGKKGKGKGKGKKGKGTKSSTEAEDLIDVAAEARTQVAMLTTLPVAEQRTVSRLVLRRGREAIVTLA